MSSIDAFESDVARRYLLYNGLFLSLPFAEVHSAGILLPVFADYCRTQLQSGASPESIVESFVHDRLSHLTADEQTEYLFKFMQIAERQVVLFDAIEDAAFGRVHELDGPGTIHDLAKRVSRTQRNRDLQEAVERFRVRVVLTAHPTQFYPDEVLAILTDLADAVQRSDTDGVHKLLLQMGKTRFKNRRKPSPLDEARSLLWYIENVFYEALPQIQRELSAQIENDSCVCVDVAPVAELGFWPGGDRDGNPFVTAELTRKIGSLLHRSILGRYRADLQRVLRRLTFPGVSERLREIERRIEATVNAFDDDPAPASAADSERSGYSSAVELVSDLRRVYDEVEQQHDGLFKELVAELIYKTRIFGFHFASMDLRQDSRVHRLVVAQLLGMTSREEAGHYDSLDVEEKIALLARHAAETIGPESLLARLPEGIAKETLLSIQAAQRIQASNGIRGLHRYIISNTRDAANIVEVWFLAHCAGWEASELELDIVPLFETVDDLDHAEQTMRLLFGLPLYREHLRRRGWIQTIMVGFSDGTKDGGYVTANWEIFRAKQRMTRLAREAGISVVFFDGRGGPPARGGGNTHMFYRTLGRSIESKEIHLTIQGQTISSNFGTITSAKYNTEQLVTAGLETMVFPDEHVRLDEGEIALLDELSSAAAAAYSEVKEHREFLAYLEEMTPLRFYGRTNIGSRPASRGSSSKLELDSLRAIPFVGAWSQLKQNVPGYFGFGTALRELTTAGEGERLRSLYSRSRFFRTLVENAMQSLSKTFFALTAFIAEDPRFGQLWKRLQEEALLTTEQLLAVSGQRQLLERDATIRRSIQMREAIVLPVLTIQQYALAKLRAVDDSAGDSPSAAILDKMVIKSMAAAVNAARNAV